MGEGGYRGNGSLCESLAEAVADDHAKPAIVEVGVLVEQSLRAPAIEVLGRCAGDRVAGLTIQHQGYLITLGLGVGLAALDLLAEFVAAAHASKLVAQADYSTIAAFIAVGYDTIVETDATSGAVRMTVLCHGLLVKLAQTILAYLAITHLALFAIDDYRRPTAFD